MRAVQGTGRCRFQKRRALAGALSGFGGWRYVFRAGQCEECDGGGYKGDVAAFDIFRADGTADIFHHSSALSLEEYALALAKEGLVAAEDVLRIDADALYRMSQLWSASRDALAQTTATHQTQLARLELTSRVLQQQTEASISLQQVSHALITLNTPEELGDYICQKARVLCGADRAILYWMHPDHTAEILALSGWDASLLHKQMDAESAVWRERERRVGGERADGVQRISARHDGARTGRGGGLFARGIAGASDRAE